MERITFQEAKARFPDAFALMHPDILQTWEEFTYRVWRGRLYFTVRYPDGSWRRWRWQPFARPTPASPGYWDDRKSGRK